jgi:hypothetical protein
MEIAAAVFLLAAVAALVWLQYRAILERRAERARFVAAILPLLDDARIDASAVDFPKVHGRYKGHTVLIEPHTDSIALRKLPSLWLLVTLREDLPLTASLGVMMRPRNTEYWSPFDRYPIAMQRPANWPDLASLRTDRAEGAGALRALIEPHLDFLRDPRGKEILLTPRGVRFTWLAEEGERGPYLIARQVTFSGRPLDAGIVRGLLDRCVAAARAAHALKARP